MSDVQLFDHQSEYLDELPLYNGRTWPRTCLYFKTGAGKTLASLLALERWGYDHALVIAPPATHPQWEAAGLDLGITLDCMSHAKFRMKDTLVSKVLPVIADEFHLFGGHKGKGWRKFERMAQGLQAPIQMLSATPNYNDAERCYCIHRILDRAGTSGGYLQWLYQHCTTEANPFGIEPRVTGFRDHPDAGAFLASLPGVWHLPDERVIHIEDVVYDERLPRELREFGYDRRNHRMMASQIEYFHTARYQGLVNGLGHIRPQVMDEIIPVIDSTDRLLIFSNHSSVAVALGSTLSKYHIDHRVVTGATPKARKLNIIREFNRGEVPVLVGTASLATGTDGMDKVCDTLLIIDDTDDDSLRRQLIGRILPRGDAPLVDKRFIRLVPA